MAFGDRKTPLKRTGGPKRKTELTRTGPPTRSSRLASRSPATIAEAPIRADVRAACLARDGNRCQLAGYGACRGRLEVHEVVRRSSKKGSHLDVDLTTTLCAGHHELDGRRPIAERLGIRVTRWAYDKHGPAILKIAADHRALARTGTLPPIPSWR